MITNFQIFCKRQTLFFVVLRTRPKEDLKEKKFLFVWWLQTNCVILPNMKARYFPPPGGRTVVSFSEPSLPNMAFLDGVHFSSRETAESICKRWKVNNCTQNSVKKNERTHRTLFMLTTHAFVHSSLRNGLRLKWRSRGGSRGRVQGVPPPPEMTCGFLIQLIFCKKNKLCGLLVLK